METTVDNLGLETYYTLEQELKTLQRERDLLNLKIKGRTCCKFCEVGDQW